MTRRPVSPAWLVAACALWMAAAGNAPLWRRLSDLGLLQTTPGVLFAASMLVSIAGLVAAILALFAWRPTFKTAASALLVTTAIASYFMLAYGVVMDPGMITNALQTDPREASALASWRLAASIIVLAVLPGWLLWRQPVAYGGLRRQLGRNLLLVVAGLVVGIGAIFLSAQTMASVMRNHKEVRYLVNPLASVYSAGSVALRPFARDDSVLVRTGEDAKLAASATSRKRPFVLLLVLGETGRSDNFSINGYARPTTPELEHAGVASFRNAWSCGTSTAASVPCMFSDLGRDNFDSRKNRREGVLDVLQRAGLAVLWIDNQSGCKGVCDRVPTTSTASGTASPLCVDGECLDGVMLEGLDKRIAALDPARVARGLVIVMHQMGSHGPAYHLRSPADMKRFLPECTSAALQDCSREEVVNAYDNSIAYTDHFLGQAIGWLQARGDKADTAMVYVADHGESLGENNIYLHGLPYSVAPDVQKHVPWITWLSAGFERRTGLSPECLRAARDQRISHDNYFHSVLGLAGVETSAYRAELDAYAACHGRVGHVAAADRDAGT